jgi:two-component system, LytTR family, sensor kinase
MQDSTNGASRIGDRASAVRGDAAPSEPDRPVISSSNIEPTALPSLLRYPTTWRVLFWWTIAYAISSWLVEYFVSMLDPGGHISLLFALNRVVYAVVWSGANVVAIIITERLPVTSTKQIGRILVHAAVCLAVTALWGVLAYYLCLAVVPGWKPLGVARMLSSTAKNVLFGYGLVVVLVHIALRMRLHRANEVALLRQAHLAAQAQLQLLKVEMQPHFLFNALHSISALIDSDPRAANDTLALVSDMLRHAVDTVRIQEVSLREELSTLRLYTQIQQVRFGERLHLMWDVDDVTLDAAVPHMLLQPLVENAIKHGLEAHSSAGRVVISSRKEGDALCLSIQDDGPGYRVPNPRSRPGVGIANVVSRLTQLYGEQHSFSVLDAPSGGTQVTIRIPFVLMTTAGENVPLYVVDRVSRVEAHLPKEHAKPATERVRSVPVVNDEASVSVLIAEADSRQEIAHVERRSDSPRDGNRLDVT